MVVHLLSKEALDRYGEITMPDGARLLTLRTIKPDGGIVEAELVPGKDGLSLRDLAVGDAVDYEFVLEREPSYGLPGYLDVSSFRFQSLDVPYHQSELLVAHPQGMTLREDRRNDPPPLQRGTLELDGAPHVTLFWQARQVPRKGVEPGVRALLDELPSVRVYTDLDLAAYLRGIALQIRKSQRANPELRALARRLVRGKSGARERVQALWSWVVENVEDGGELSIGATGTLAARTGSRLMLLRALLREAGVHAELWLARDAYGPERIAGGHPMVETYDAAMLAVRLPDRREPLMVLTASKVLPLGYLSPGYSGSDALRIPLDERDGPAKRVTLPRSPAELADRREWDLQVTVDRSGGAVVRGKITLGGMEAVAWRQGLREIDRDRVREAFQQAELGWLRGATLRELDILNEKALAQPLVLEFVADAPDLGIAQDGALSLRSALVPLNHGASYTSLPRRVTGIVVPYAPMREVRVAFELEGAAFSEVPEAESINSSFGTFERRIAEGGVGKNRIVLEMRSTLRTGVVEPSAYDELAGFARRIEAAEQALLRAR
jgi:hypothetical protein